MNEIIEKISNVSVANTEKIHQILDQVMIITSTTFPESEIRLNQETLTFELNVEDLNVFITRDLNRFIVNVRVVKDTNTVIAECGIDVIGGFDERYAKFDNKETKLKFVTLFTAISEINVNNLDMIYAADVPAEDTDVAAEDETVADTAEVVDAEVVTE